MDVIKKLNPGEPGTKRLLAEYGEQLVCVRYRNDSQRNKRITTVELVVDEGFYLPQHNPIVKKLHPSNNRNVFLRIDYHETDLRQRVKEAGGRWKPEHKRWLMRYRDVEKLGLRDRIEEIENVDI